MLKQNFTRTHWLHLALSTLIILFSLGINNTWAGDKTFSRITSTGDLTSGAKYLIVNETNSQILDGSAVSNGSEYQSVTISSNKITCDESYAFTITGGPTNWTITGSNGKAIGHTGSKKTLNIGSYTNTIGFSSNNVNIGCNGRNLRRNSSSALFRYYTSAQSAIQLYKESASCSNKVDLTKGSPSNGSFLLTTKICTVSFVSFVSSKNLP